MRKSDLALVMATVALAYAFSPFVHPPIIVEGDFLRPPVRKPTLVWARRTVGPSFQHK